MEVAAEVRRLGDAGHITAPETALMGGCFTGIEKSIQLLKGAINTSWRALEIPLSALEQGQRHPIDRYSEIRGRTDHGLLMRD